MSGRDHAVQCQFCGWERGGVDDVQCDCGINPIDPPHYRDLTPEPIDVIEGWGLCFHLAQVVKYVSRAGRKDPAKRTEDLMKARWYLDRLIARGE